jgi:hypothetical protein
MTGEQVKADLRSIFYSFPRSCLMHLRANRHRLVRGEYHTPAGKGCIMFLLSETLPVEQRIDSKSALLRYFRSHDGPDYDPATDPAQQPAKWIIRLWDNQICQDVKKRYGLAPHLSEDTMMSVLDEVIEERTPMLQQPRTTHQPLNCRRRHHEVVPC